MTGAERVHSVAVASVSPAQLDTDGRVDGRVDRHNLASLLIYWICGNVLVVRLLLTQLTDCVVVVGGGFEAIICSS